MADPPSSELPQPGEPAWLRLARAEVGQKEIPGVKHNPVILGYYARAGFPEINNDETHWCAAFNNAMLEDAGFSGTKSLMARSFMKWGRAVAKPYPGCIAVLWRNDPRSAEGHVAFWVGETDDGDMLLLGGNQGDAVSIKPFPKAQLLGFREPVTLGKSRTVRASALGIVAAGTGATAILDSQTQLLGVNDVLKDLGASVPGLAIGVALLQILVFAVIVWARYDDLKTKGR